MVYSRKEQPKIGLSIRRREGIDRPDQMCRIHTLEMSAQLQLRKRQVKLSYYASTNFFKLIVTFMGLNM